MAEQLFASGCELLISMTSAGQLVDLAPPPYFVLIDKALRDEGTSYHYLPPMEYSVANANLLDAMSGAFAALRVSVKQGATWTTDAPFRETEAAIAAMKARGLLAVEMEAAALYAFAEARQKPVMCFAHVTNQMARIEGDFEKGEADGTVEALSVIGAAARAWLGARPRKELNLPYYKETIEEIIGIDASPGMLALAERAVATSRHKVTLLARSADDLPLDDRSIDTVVVTWSLCSIMDVGWALMEARRVLRPGGQVRFVEHGLSPDPEVAIWQDRLTPLWRRCAGDCHLNRKMDDLFRNAGFQLAELSTGYARGPRAMAYMYEGEAV